MEKSVVLDIVREVYREHYDMYRRGAFDFPEIEEC